MMEGLPAEPPATLAWVSCLPSALRFDRVAETGDRIRFDGHVDVGVRMSEEIAGKFRFSNEDTDQILALVANHMRFKDVEQMRPATLKKVCRLPRFEAAHELHRWIVRRATGVWEPTFCEEAACGDTSRADSASKLLTGV